MANINNDLFELIKSLTNAEIKQFYFFCKNQGHKEEKQYLVLFEELRKASFYDEEHTKEKLKKVIKNYAVLKNYLFDLIIKSFMLDFTSSNPIFELNKSLVEIEILRGKGLLKRSNHLIELTKKKAHECEEYQIVIQLIDQQLKNIFFKGQFNKTTYSKLIEERRTANDFLFRKNKLHILVNDLIFLENTTSFIAPNFTKRINEIKEELLALLNQQPNPVFVDIICLENLSLIEARTEAFEEAIKHISELQKKFKQLSEKLFLFKQFHYKYFNSILNKFFYEIRLKKIEQATVSIHELESTGSYYNNKPESNAILSDLTFAKCFYMLSTGKFNTYELNEFDSLNTPNKVSASMQQNRSFLIYATLLLFKKELKKLTRIFFQIETSDTQVFSGQFSGGTLLIYATLQFEKGDYEELLRLKKLALKNTITNEQSVLYWIDSLLQLLNEGINALPIKLMQLSQAINSNNNKTLLSQYFLTDWLESKIQNRPIEEILSQKILKDKNSST
ncbi:MAG: hypothetical protein J0M08_01440 [Bacteroidetes bacterium]|nr:hypothetical protein [Bacteroidota bacterium]